MGEIGDRACRGPGFSLKQKVRGFDSRHSRAGRGAKDVAQILSGKYAVVGGNQIEDRNSTGLEALTNVDAQNGPGPARQHTGAEGSQSLGQTVSQFTSGMGT